MFEQTVREEAYGKWCHSKSFLSHKRYIKKKKKRCLVTKIGKDLFTQALKNLMIISITIDEKISFQER